MSRPRLLDLFCGGGGAGYGYHLAGFEVVGVDKEKQKNYPFQFIQADALEYLAERGHCFDAIHASPPCQAYTCLRVLHPGEEYPDLVDATRAALIVTGKPYIIENVPGSPLRACLILCGTMFNLRTDCGAELRRHRLFETNWWFGMVPPCAHGLEVIGVYGDTPRSPKAYMQKYPISVTGKSPERTNGARGPGKTITVTGHTCVENTGRVKTISVYGDHPRDPGAERENSRKRSIQVVGNSPKADTTDARGDRRTITVTGSTPQRQVETNRIRETFPVSAARTAMGIPWMSMKELSQSIPPAYTKFIGLELLAYLEGDSNADRD